jgi:hypothetical protein
MYRSMSDKTKTRISFTFKLPFCGDVGTVFTSPDSEGLGRRTNDMILGFDRTPHTTHTTHL